MIPVWMNDGDEVDCQTVVVVGDDDDEEDEVDDRDQYTK